nr:TfoX/Sxy family protein [Sinorhizobium mexicanum]
MVRQDLGERPGLSEKPMFGGLAFLLNGNLLCGAREDGMLARLGKGNDDWALALPGIVQMVMGERRMHGWVRAGAEAYGDDALRRRLLDAATGFVETLPPK